MLKYACLAIMFLLASGAAANAAEDCSGPWMTAAAVPAAPPDERSTEYQRLVTCIAQRLTETQALVDNLGQLQFDAFANSLAAERDRLHATLLERSAALDSANAEIVKLRAEIASLNDQLATLRHENDLANTRIAGLLDALKGARDELAAMTAERDDLLARLNAANASASALQKQVDDLTAQLAAANGGSADLQKQLDAANAGLASANSDIAALKQQLAETEAQLVAATQHIVDLNNQVGDLQKQLAGANAKIADLESQLAAAKAAATAAADRIAALMAEIEKLNQRVAALQQQVVTLKAELGDTNAKLDGANARLGKATADLDAANAKIASLECKVDRLGDERSAFFTQLKTILAGHDGISVVGDRFVFDASVLFPVGKEALTPEGHDTIVQVAGVVRKLEQDIPTTLHWVLQVNGHTDVQKIGRGAKFKSNWELSTARALSVVELLLDEQVQGEHVAAAGFGEFQPIDPAPTQEAYAKNRRIELKLTDEGPADGVVMRSDGTPCPAT